MEILECELGKALRAQEVADYLGTEIKSIRKYYRELGGIRIGRQYRFFERRLSDAIQKRTEMGGPSEERRAEVGEGVRDQEGSQGLGNRNEAKARRRVEREDPHNILA